MAMLRWTVRFAVDSSWVADGFDLTDERAKDMLNGDLRYAMGCELGARVLSYPPAIRVARLQHGSGKGLEEATRKVEERRKRDKL